MTARWSNTGGPDGVQIDHQVGRIRIALNDLGLAGNTLIVYSTDHGDWLGMLGMHGTYEANMAMNKADLTEVLAERAGIPKVRAAHYINILTSTIQDALVQEEKVTISDFGTFTVSKRRALISVGLDFAVDQTPSFRTRSGLK